MPLYIINTGITTEPIPPNPNFLFLCVMCTCVQILLTEINVWCLPQSVSTLFSNSLSLGSSPSRLNNTAWSTNH